MTNVDIVDDWSGKLLPLTEEGEPLFIASYRLQRLVKKGLASLGFHAKEARAMMRAANIGACLFPRDDDDPLQALWTDNYVEVPITGQHAREVVDGLLLDETERQSDAFYRVAMCDEVVMWPMDRLLFIGRRALSDEVA